MYSDIQNFVIFEIAFLMRYFKHKSGKNRFGNKTKHTTPL